MKSIPNKIKTRKKNLESGNGDLAKYSSEIIDLENELNELNERRSPFVKKVDLMVKELTKVREQVKKHAHRTEDPGR